MADWREVLTVDLVGTAHLVDAVRPLATDGTAIVCFASISASLALPDVDQPADAVLDDPLHAEFLERIREAVGPDARGLRAWPTPGPSAASIVWSGARPCRFGRLGRQDLLGHAGHHRHADGAPGGGHPRGHGRMLVQASALGREGRPEEVAAGVAFLLSDEARLRHGHRPDGRWRRRRRGPQRRFVVAMSQPHRDRSASRVDVRGLLDPELRPVLGAFELPPIDADGIAAIRVDGVPGAGSLRRGGANRARRARRPTRPRAGPPSGRRRGRAAGHRHDPRRRLRHRHLRHGRPPARSRGARRSGIVGVSVDYRLAPETPYPGPARGLLCRAALDPRQRRRAGIDRARIGIYGLSAGGGLAAALALLARDRGEVPLAFQLLDCPMLDDRQTTPSIAGRRASTCGTPASNEFGWRSYLGHLYGSDDVPPYAAAARATDLAGLPPTCIVVGSIDGFRDEDVDYAQRLNQAGVPVRAARHRRPAPRLPAGAGRGRPCGWRRTARTTGWPGSSADPRR